MHKVPIFIVGINPRSGTNYLYQLIALHPDCVHSRHYGEDFFLFASDKYLEFYDVVTKHWSPDWKNDNEVFRRALELGLLNYLNPGNGPAAAKYMVTKTPSAINSKNYLEMFSEGYMIVITRKGQDLVESFMKTFSSRFEDAVRGWKRGAAAIHDVMNDPKLMKSGRVLVIKYEDLYQKNTEVMTQILDFLKLDKSKFDFDKSANFDVIGSSTFKGNSEKVTWDPIPKTKTFNPLGRFSHWSRFRHYRYNWMAGKYSKEFGYELYFDSKDPIYYIYNILLTTYDFFHRSVRRTMIILKSFSRGKNARRDAFNIKIN
ncbi:MAG: sulfotransferase [Bacteroidia bacterium]|nr:sulfotransferase [Bacteroidia bacterium]